jgi:hypothetical protein
MGQIIYDYRNCDGNIGYLLASRRDSWLNALGI